MFLGTHVNGLDVKGRASVPADFRAVVRTEGLEGVYCWPSPEEACLVGCGAALMARFKALQDDLPLLDPRRSMIGHSIFADARTLNFDANGRVTLPDDFIKHAKLDGQIAFVGLSDHFQIWRPDAYETYRDSQRTKMRDAMRAQAGAAA
jgi:MraZ protein